MYVKAFRSRTHIVEWKTCDERKLWPGCNVQHLHHLVRCHNLSGVHLIVIDAASIDQPNIHLRLYSAKGPKERIAMSR
jgi:hypothetical protein